jgi:hypothetical protein
MTDHAPKAPRLRLQNVAVAFEQTKVYANKRQQARFRLELECTHDGNADYLTPSEVDGISVFAYAVTGSTIPFSDDGSATYEGWSAQREPLGYLSQTGTPARAGPRQTYYRYLTAGPEAVETLRVSFRVTGDDGSIFRTNGFVTINGVEQYDNTFDKKEGITVARVDPVHYPASAFELIRRPYSSSRFLRMTPAGVFGRMAEFVRRLLSRRSHAEKERADIFDDIVTLSIVLPDQTRLGIRTFQCDPAGSIHWKDKVSWVRQPCFTGYAAPGSTEIHWNESGMADHWGGQPRPKTLEQAEIDVGVIVLCGRIDIPSWSGAPEAPVKVTLIDAHGSDQTCRIAFERGERDKLIVT